MFFFEILKAILFGAVEGITEWLPISSTGHMILLDELIALRVSEDFYELFSVVIQLGAILAVAASFWRRLTPVGKTGADRRQVYRLWGLIILGTLPSAAVGFFLDDYLDRHFYNYPTVALMLILWGIVFIAAERAKKGKEPRISDISQLSPRDALTVGIFQIFALIPGTSRSGATILGAFLSGASRSVACEYSFFLAIPTMVGAGLLKASKFALEGNRMSAGEQALLLVGAATAFLLSVGVIKILTELVRRHSFSGFGAYRIILGLCAILYFLISKR